jgi:hypothetical protein
MVLLGLKIEVVCDDLEAVSSVDVVPKQKNGKVLEDGRAGALGQAET